MAPMRAELTRLGIRELLTASAVDDAFAAAEGKSTLLVINSVCGCAAANARPAVAMAVQAAATQPDELVTVFAGQDLEATAQAREFLPGIPPSSPFIALFRDGEPVFALERRHIEGRTASAIAADLLGAFDKFCDGEGEGEADKVERPPVESETDSKLPDTFRSIL